MPDTLEDLLALCRRPESPAIIEAAGLSAQTAANCVERLQAEGFTARLMDGAMFHSEPAMIEVIGAAFAFPDSFERSWDGLVDGWTDRTRLSAAGYFCIIENANHLANTHRELLDGLRTASEQAADRWKNSGEDIHFKLVLLSESPAHAAI